MYYEKALKERNLKVFDKFLADARIKDKDESFKYVKAIISDDNEYTPKVKSFVEKAGYVFKVDYPYLLAYGDSLIYEIFDKEDKKFIVKSFMDFYKFANENRGYSLLTMDETFYHRIVHFHISHFDAKENIKFIIMDYGGESIWTYLANNKNMLKSIQKQYKRLFNNMNAEGICHTDYHLGNVVVKNHKLYLIDYEDIERRKCNEEEKEEMENNLEKMETY